MKTINCLLLTTLFILSFAGSLYAADDCSIKSTDTYKKIKTAIDKIGIVSSHEHIRPEKRFLKRKQPPDFFDIVLQGYVRSDIRNTGNTFEHDEKFRDKSLSVEQRWASFKPVYDRIKNTGYTRSVITGIEKVHGIKVTDAESIKKINKSIANLYSKPGIYQKTLRDIGNIDLLLAYGKFNQGFKPEDWPDYIKVVSAFDHIVVFTSQDDIYKLEKRFGVLIHDLDDMEKAYRKYVDMSLKSGVVGFKWTGAYLRTLDFPVPSRDKAEMLLKKLLRVTEARFSWAGGKAFSIEGDRELSNYLMHLMLKIIEEKGASLSVHTGIQVMGSNDIRNSNPQHLIPLFKEYKNINFDLFHGGFPYTTEFVELGKSWPNVYLNLCWSHIIYPEGTRAQLSEMLECVPINKIFAFGADSYYPEQTIGHLEMAKDNCAVVLAEKVINGYFTYDEAVEYAERILRTNLLEFWKIDIDKK